MIPVHQFALPKYLGVSRLYGYRIRHCINKAKSLVLAPNTLQLKHRAWATQ